MSRLADLNAAYLQARRDYAAGLICEADLDYARERLDQALDNAPETR